MAHIITEAELADYVEDQRSGWIQYACSSDGQNVKRLEFRLHHVAPIYKVSFQGRDIYVGAIKETAVREYNALP